MATRVLTWTCDIPPQNDSREATGRRPASPAIPPTLANMSRLSPVPAKEVPAMRLHRRAKAAVRHLTRGRVVLGVMLRLPAGRGPALWRKFADRARVAAADQLLLQAGDFEAAQEA